MAAQNSMPQREARNLGQVERIVPSRWPGLHLPDGQVATSPPPSSNCHQERLSVIVRKAPGAFLTNLAGPTLSDETRDYYWALVAIDVLGGLRREGAAASWCERSAAVRVRSAAMRG